VTLYSRLGGYDVLLAIARRWHELCLTDELAAHPFTHTDMHPQHDERLAAYLAEACGGPRLYTGGYGDESTMQRMHAGNGVWPELDELCLTFFDQACAEHAADATAGADLAAYFRRATDAMNAYGESVDLVPDDLEIRRARS
jgi:hemoglobin